MQARVIAIYKNDTTATLEKISIQANSSLRYASMIISDFKEFGESQEEDTFLVPSLDLGGVFYLFINYMEKTVRTSNFKIQNSEEFTKNELDWLQKNYKFKAR